MAFPILGRKARVTLIPGCLLGFVGVLVASAQSGESWDAFVGNLGIDWVPYMLAFVAAVCWALYSNLTRRWARDAGSGAVPLFILASGLVLAGLRLLFPETSHWTSQSMFELAYMSVFPTILAYTFWDTAMRRGNMILVASLSYLTPLLLIIIGSIHLGVGTGLYLWLGCLLVIVGSFASKLSIEETP